MGGEVALKESWTLVDEDENGANDDRGQDGTPEHASVADSTSYALENIIAIRGGHPEGASRHALLAYEMWAS